MRLFATLLMGFCLLAAQVGPVWAGCQPQKAEESVEMPCHQAAEKPSPMPKMPCCGDQCHCLQGLVMVLPATLPSLSEAPAEWVELAVQNAYQSIIPPIPTSPPKPLSA